MDLLLLNMYLGSVIFITGMVISSLIIRKFEKQKLKIILLIILQFLLAYILSLMIWRFWFFNFDIMLNIISLPALIAETFVILIIYLIYRSKFNRKQ